MNTQGWVGIGFSNDGSMKDADIHVGWVKNGRAYITVCIFLQRPIIVYLSRLFRVVPFDFMQYYQFYGNI